ncbi:MAG: hypothetical protein ABI772_02810 [Bacteroidota bacterium]
MKTEHKANQKSSVSKPHPSPDPTKHEPGKTEVQIPVLPDEDNDFTTPSKEIKEPENPGTTPGEKPIPRIENERNFPGPDSVPLPDSPLKDPTEKGDPGFIDPSTSQQTALKPHNTGKNIFFSFLIALLLSCSLVNAEKVPVISAKSDSLQKTEMLILTNRLEEINNMDKSELKPHEKKELRSEVKSIRKKMAETSGGVYLSVGAIIIIILLLILLV